MAEVRQDATYRPPPRATLVSDVDDNRPIRLLVVLRPQSQRIAETGDRLTKSQLIAQYRCDRAVVDRLFAHAAAHGLSATETDATGNTITLTGTYGQARAAFRPEHLAIYDDDKRRYVARSGHLYLPAGLADDIVAIMGFDGRTVPARHFYSPQPADVAVDGAYQPAEVAKLYEFPPALTGQGQTIGVIALGGGFNEQWLQAYFAKNGITRTGDLVAISVDGTPNDPTMGADSDYNERVREVHMDIEVLGSIAPGARIVVYFASYQDIAGLQAALQYAVTDSVNAPSVISVSWHYPEDIALSTYKGPLDSINQALEMAKVGNVTVCVASGDYGANEDPNAAQPTVSVPACSPFALACGGTRRLGQGAEVAWERSGGGYSSYFAQPSYQNGVAPMGMKRGVPDVSAIADPGYVFSVNESDFNSGGTSVSAPLWAALIALLNQRIGRPVGFINPVIYGHTDSFTDITTGGNAQFQAQAGWDPITGLGTPKGTSLIELFQP